MSNAAGNWERTSEQKPIRSHDVLHTNCRSSMRHTRFNAKSKKQKTKLERQTYTFRINENIIYNAVALREHIVLLTCFSGFRILLRSIFVVELLLLLSRFVAIAVDDVLIAGVAFRSVTFMMVLRFCDGDVGDDGVAGNDDDTIVVLLRSTLGMVATKLVANLWLQSLPSSSPSLSMLIAFRLFAIISVSNCSRIELAQSFVFFISDADAVAAAAVADVIRLIHARFSPYTWPLRLVLLLLLILLPLLSWLSASIDCSLFALLWFGILAVFVRGSCSSSSPSSSWLLLSAGMRPPIVHDDSLLLLTLLLPSILLPLWHFVGAWNDSYRWCCGDADPSLNLRCSKTSFISRCKNKNKKNNNNNKVKRNKQRVWNWIWN